MSILERIRLTQHGGSVVIARTPFNEQLAHVTYTVSEHAGLAGEIVAYKTLDDLLLEPHSNIDAGAFSVCQKCEQAIGLIVSQDGEVKAVKADGVGLLSWNGILD